MSSLKQYVETRSLKKSSGCVDWIGTLDRGGYGVVQRARGTKRMQAHRAAYQLFCAPIPDGMTVDHLCFNRACVNPEHLRLLTRSENARRQRKALSPLCANGHALSGRNLRIDAGGRRRCRICVRENARQYRNRKRGGVVSEAAP